MGKSNLVVVLLLLAGHAFCQPVPPQQIFLSAGSSASGVKYEGPLVDGVPSGRGKITYRNVAVVEGKFEQGVLIDDQARVEISMFGVVVGKFVNGTLVSGVVDYITGEHYEGGLSPTYKRSGRGVLTDVLNNAYFGEFENNELHGKGGIANASSGKTYMGNFKNGKLEGEVMTYESSGKVAPEYYKDGVNLTDSYEKDRVKALRNADSIRRDSRIEQEVRRGTEEFEAKIKAVEQQIKDEEFVPGNIEDKVILKRQVAGGAHTEDYLQDDYYGYGYLKIAGKTEYRNRDLFDRYRYPGFRWDRRGNKGIEWTSERFSNEVFKVVTKLKTGEYLLRTSDEYFSNADWRIVVSVDPNLTDDEVIDVARQMNAIENELDKYMQYIFLQTVDDSKIRELRRERDRLDQELVNKKWDIRNKLRSASPLKSEKQILEEVRAASSQKVKKATEEYKQKCATSQCICYCTNRPRCRTCEY